MRNALLGDALLGNAPLEDPAYLAYLLVFTAAAAGCLAGAWQAYFRAGPAGSGPASASPASTSPASTSPARTGLSGIHYGLAALLLASGLWALFHVGMLLASGLWGKTAFYEAGLVVGFGTVFGWLWLCSAFSGRALHRSRKVQLGALALFALVTLTKLTNPWHGLYFSAGWETVPFRHLAIDHHVLYWITAGLSYAGAVVGFFMLSEPLRRTEVGSGRLAALFSLTALPLGANAIGYGTPYLLDLSHEPIGVAAFALGALFLTRGRSGEATRLEEAARAGRRDEPALVLSGEGRIRNYNRRATRLFPALRHDGAVGARVEDVLPELYETLPGREGPSVDPEEGPVENHGGESGEVGFEEAGSVLEAGGEAAGDAPRYFRPVETTFRRGRGRLVALADVTERELRRQNQEARLEAISSSMPGVAFEFRAGPGGEASGGERSVEFIGAEAETLLGLSPGLSGFYDRFVGHIPGSYRKEFLQSVEEAIRGRKQWREEFPFDRPGGDRIWLLGSSRPEVKEAPGGEEVVVFRGTLTDITGRAEEQRRRKQAIQRTTDGIVEVGPDWQITLVNDQAEQFYGMDEAEMLGRSAWEVFPAMEGTCFEEAYREVMQTRKPSSVEAYYSGLGEWFDVQIYPNEDGGLSFYFDVITERKEREETLRKLQEKYRGLMEGAPNPIFVANVDSGQIVEANQAAASLLGAPADEIIGCHQSELHPSGEARKYQSLFEKAMGDVRDETTSFSTLEDGSQAYVETSAGERVPVEISATVVELGSGESREGEGAQERVLVGIFRDITDRKRRKQKLKRRNDLFRRAQEIADVGGWEYDAEAGEGIMTDRAYHIYGLSPEADVTAERTLSLYHPEDRPKIREAFHQAVEEGKSYDLELRLTAETGEEKWARVRGEPKRGVGGEVTRVRGTIQDITDRKRRERALQERREKIEALYSATGQLLRAKRREEVSARIHEVIGEVFDYPFSHTGFVEKTAGRAEENSTGENSTEGNPIEETPVEENPAEENPTEERPTEGDLLVPGRTEAAPGLAMPEPEPCPTDGDTVAACAIRAGEAVVVENTETLDNPIEYGDLRSAVGVPIGKRGAIVVGEAQEGRFDRMNLRLLEMLGSYAALVLGRLQREESLREAKKETEEATQLKSAMLANMSHEIRTPLTSIIGFAEAIGENEEAAGRFAPLIEKGGKRLMKTLEGVLNLSKLEAGQMTLEAEPIDLATQAQRVAEELRPKAEEKGLELSIDACQEAWGLADEGGVQIVLQNLLSNAIKYTESGTVAVRTYREGGRVALEVEDTGIGMEPEVAGSLFEPFRQASEGFGRKYEGTGVGLAVTKKAVDEMDGSIEVETQKGAGSRFTARLPAATGENDTEKNARGENVSGEGATGKAESTTAESTADGLRDTGISDRE